MIYGDSAVLLMKSILNYDQIFYTVSNLERDTSFSQEQLISWETLLTL